MASSSESLLSRERIRGRLRIRIPGKLVLGFETRAFLAAVLGSGETLFLNGEHDLPVAHEGPQHFHDTRS